MSACTDIRFDMLDLLQGACAPGGVGRVEEHVNGCEACEIEWAGLRRSWESLPTTLDAAPPPAARLRVFSYSAASVGSPDVWVDLRRVVKDFVSPAVLGAVAAFVIASLTSLRGAQTPFDRGVSVAAALVLAALLAVVGGALLRGGARTGLRAVLLGALGAFGGYWVLDLAIPVSDAVRVCGLAVFGAGSMSLGQVCVVYLVVASLYAGIPLALAAYFRSVSTRPWRSGLAEGSIFGALVIPLVVLQTSPEGWMIAVTVAMGVVVGAFVGELSGSWVKRRQTSSWVSV